MGGGELNCGQDTPLASVCQSGSGPTVPAGAGRYSGVLNGIQPGACGGSAAGLRCLPGATGTTRPPTERWGYPSRALVSGGEGSVLTPSAWHTRPSGQVWDEDDHLSRDEKPLGVRPDTSHLKGVHRAGSGALQPRADRVHAVRRGQGGHAQAVHDDQVVVDRLALVQVEGAGELLQVYQVGQVTLAEAQDAERASRRGVAAQLQRDELEADV